MSGSTFARSQSAFRATINIRGRGAPLNLIVGLAFLSVPIRAQAADPEAGDWTVPTTDIYYNRPMIIKNIYAPTCSSRDYWPCLYSVYSDPWNGDYVTQSNFWGYDGMCPVYDYPIPQDTHTVPNAYVYRFSWDPGDPTTHLSAERMKWDSTLGQFVGTDYCIDVPSGVDYQINLQMYECHGGDNQLWENDGTASWGSPYFSSGRGMHSVDHTDMCWDLPCGGTPTATRLQQYECHQGPVQLYKFQYYDCKKNGDTCSSGSQCCTGSCQSSSCAYPS